MAASSFTLEWDDFTGGYHVGPSHANQPHNTWRGTGVYCDPNDGMLNGVPDWTAITYTSGTPTTQGADTTSHLYTDGRSVWRIYMTSTANTANVCTYSYSGAFTASITNTSISNCGVLLASVAWNGQYLFISYVPSSGTENLVRFDLTSNTITKFTTPEVLRHLARWGEFMVGGGATTGRRLFYSAAYDPTSWSSADYYDIGDFGSITAVVPFGDTLYISKSEGWWALTGVLGESVTIRRVAEGRPGTNGGLASVVGGGVWSGANGMCGAVATPDGVLFTSKQLEQTAMILNGGVVVPANHAPPDLSLSADDVTAAGWRPIRIMPGLYALTAPGLALTTGGTAQIGWLLDANPGLPRWAKISFPYSPSIVPQGKVATYLPDHTGRGTLFVDVSTTIYKARLYPSDDITSGGVTADVRLSPRRRVSPFVVKSLYVETCWSASADASPALTATVEMRGWTDITSPGRIAPAAVTNPPSVESTTPTVALYHDDRFVYATKRFDLSAPAGTECVPIITFNECKIRRVWAVCQPAETT
jgi:hypothetical protein